MTPDFRALCAELVDELHGYASANPHHDSDELVARARAALAAEPEPPADGEVAELVAWLRNEAKQHADSWPEASAKATRLADFLERLAEPEPVGPTDEELWALGNEDFRANCYPTDAIRYARAVLARWGSQS